MKLLLKLTGVSLLVAIGLGPVLPSHAAVTNTMTATANAFVLRSSATSDQSEAQTLVTKRLNDSNSRVAYVRFDVSSFLNSNSPLNLISARLRLYYPGGASDSVRVYGLLNQNVNGGSDAAWTGVMTWNNQPAKTAAPDDIPNSSSALPNANTTAQLGSQSFSSTAAEVSVDLNLPTMQQLLLDDSNQQITLVFFTSGGNTIGWASLANTSGFLVPTLELVATPSAGPPAALTWDGAVNGNWDTNTANWKTNPAAPSTAFKNIDSVTFNDAKSGPSTVTLTIPVSPGSVLVSNATVNYTFSGSGQLAGITGLEKKGAGTLTINNDNIYAGATIVSGGTIKAGHSAAFGSSLGALIVSNGATLDINAKNLTTEPVEVSGAGVGGNGAIVNTGSQQTSALRTVTLRGDTTVGGSGRWDIRNSGGSASLSTAGQPHKLIKVGGNQFSLVGVSVDAVLGDIEVRQGMFSAETSTTSLGNPASTLSVSNGATLQFYQNSFVLKKNLLLAGGATVNNNSGVNTFGGPVTFAGNATINVNSGTELFLTNSLGGSGGFTKNGSGALRLTGGTHNYTGATLVNAGELVLNGQFTGGGALTTAAGTILAGVFTHTGMASVSGALYPGDVNVPGVMTCSGLTLNPGATVRFELFPGSTDLLQVNGNLMLNNNTVTISPLATLQTNVSYRLVNYTGTLTGTFNPGLNLDPSFAASLDYSTPGQINIIFSQVSTFTIPTQYPTGPGPMNITLGPDGKLVYHPDPNGDLIPDFSSAGYRGSAVPIPDVPAVTNLTPVPGDNLARIQGAIDALAAQPLGTNGFRGAIQLAAGVYEMSGGLLINASGIVLRGAGDGLSGTILRRTAGGSDIVEIRNGAGGRSEVPGTRKELTDVYVPLGVNWFRVEDTAGLSVGDEITIVRRSTTAWLNAINQPNWSAGSFNVQMMRTIVAIEGDRIMIDSPLIQSIDQANGYGGGYMYKYVWPGLTENVGVEDIRADCTVSVDSDNNTSGQFMEIVGARNCWVRRCTNDRMKGHTMKITSNAKWITVQDLVSFHYPQLSDTSSANIQIHTFESSAQGLLYHRITASHGGFEWSSGGMGSGPTVFSECTVPAAYAFSGPHMKWACGVLYDSLWMNQGLNVLKHDGSHGFGGANHLAWNVEVSSMHFDRPPTAHQWNIGCVGNVSSSEPRSGALPCERISQGKHVEPGNLFRAQLAARIGAAEAYAVLGNPDGANPFELVALPETNSVAPGQNVSCPILMAVPPDYGGQTVMFSFNGLPAGVAAGFATSTRNSGGTNFLNVVASNNAPVGVYLITIKGSGTFPVRGGGSALTTRTITMKLNITGPNNFSLAAAPFYQTIEPGGATSFAVNVAGTNGFGGNVALSVAGLPAGVSASFEPPTVTGAGESTLSLTASNNAASGSYTVTILGASGGLTSGATTKLGVGLTGALPEPWEHADIGSPALAGSATYSNSMFTVKGSGTDIWSTADQFQFAWQLINGDFTITARVTSQANTDPWAKAGVMVRESPNANSKYVSVYVTPTSSHGVSLQYRSATGGSAVDVAQASGPTVPHWVRLVRQGNTFQAYRSADGVTWTQVGTNLTAVSLPAEARVGLAVCSHDAAELSAVTFENVSVVQPDFDISASPDSQSVTAGQNAPFTVAVGALNFFNSAVTLSATGLPAGFTANFAPPVVAAPGNSTLTLSMSSNTTEGNFSVIVSGTDGIRTHEAQVILQVVAADTDEDGIPDWWMLEHFGHVSGQAEDHSRAEDDADQDGMSNGDEFRSGTNPLNPDSCLRMVRAEPEGDDVRITWLAVEGKSYVVEFAPGLAAAFTEVSDPIEVTDAGESEVSFVHLGGVTNGPARFYRVRLEP